MKKYLITGGTGFIGSYLVDSLIEQGHQVIVVDSLLTSGKENLNSKAKFFKMDVCDPKIFDIFKTEKPNIVYHLAGPIDLRREINDPLFIKSQNVLERIKIICRCCSLASVKKIVFFSSGGAIYSGVKTIYCLANLMIEKYIELYGLDYVILRLSNVYGPRQWKKGIIPQIIINKEPKIKGDGTQIRDFIYIDDVIEAAILTIDKNGIYNVGAGEEHSINEIIDMVRKISNSEIKPIYEGVEKVKRSVLNIEKIKKELNWKPKVSLEQGLKKTIDWYEKYSF